MIDMHTVTGNDSPDTDVNTFRLLAKKRRCNCN